jgi:hypothetical protein
MADLLMADPEFIGSIFTLIAIGIASGIILIILLKVIGMMGEGE